jgi:hypothetical protein
VKIEPNQGPGPVSPTAAVDPRDRSTAAPRTSEGTSVTYSANLQLLQKVIEEAKAASALRQEALRRAESASHPSSTDLARAMVHRHNG